MGAQAVRLSNVDIDNALKNKHFEVLFQPIFDLGNGALARVETFVRWRHPSLGVLPPGAFISFFESQGRMSELTRYVLAEALKQYCAWRGPSAPGFSINLALSDLSDDAFAGRFAVLLRDSGFPADLITLECPMPPVTMEIEAAAECFHRLAETGARLAIEVRGRANDFLRQIDPFPFDEIKTGGAAILRFARTVRGPGLSAISELLEIAQKANAAITAVGVEDQASLSALRGLGFAAAQGNHLGKVGPLDAFEPRRVNDVRQLLGLPPLSPEEISAIFRTEAPTPLPANFAAEDAAPPAPASDVGEDELVERLAARLARQADQDKAESADDAPRKKKPRTQKDLKAAAIARAKRKAAENAIAPHNPDVSQARSLQERLTREFAAAQAESPAEETDAFAFADEDASPISPEETGQAEAAAAQSVETPAPTAEAEPAAQPESEPAAQAPADKKPDSQPAEATAPTEPVAEPGATIRSLLVKGARAYFRPGYFVRAARPLAPPCMTEMRPSVAPDAPPAADAKDKSAPVLETPVEEFEIAAIDVGEEVESGTDVAAESQAAEISAAPAATRRRRRKPRNFLTRKYQVWPTHFWPRSWKRAWRKRRSERRTEPAAAE